MKRLVFGNLQMILAVLVLAAITADLLLPFPACTSLPAKAASVAESAVATGPCIGLSATTDRGLREP